MKKNDSEPSITEHTFKKNKYFIPALLFKYPDKKIIGITETTITSLKNENGILMFEKLKRAKYKLKKPVFGKEKFIFNFTNKKIKYYENDLERKHFEIIDYDFNDDIFYKKTTWKNKKYNFFYKCTNWYGNNRMEKLMKQFGKNEKSIQELIDIDLDLLFD